MGKCGRCEKMLGLWLHVTTCFFFFFKQKTSYEITYGDWSSDVCSSDLPAADGNGTFASLFEPSLNNHEAVAYRVRLAGTAGGALDDEAVYKGDSALVVVPKLED